MSANDPHERGYQAFLDGDDEDSNPYTSGTTDHELWREGFDEAAMEDEEEDEEEDEDGLF